MPVAVVAAGIGAAGSVASSSSSKKGAKKAARVSAQNNAANRALAEKLYGETKQMYQGSLDTGNWAQGTINALLGKPGTDQASAQAGLSAFRNSGGYQTALTEGTRGIAGNRAASGAFLSGATAKALQDRANYLGQQTLGTYMNGLGNQQTIGENAKNAITGQATGTTQMIVNGNNNDAANQANAALARANAQSNLWKDLGSLGAGAYGQLTASSYNGASPGGIQSTLGGMNLGGPSASSTQNNWNVWGANNPFINNNLNR